MSYPDYSYFTVPDSAFAHTAEQVLWDAPRAGKWQLIVWAPGFSGDSFAERFAGSITLGAGFVGPTTWTASAAAGTQVSNDFTVTNGGPTALNAYAESQAIWNGMPQSQDVVLTPATGKLTPDLDGYLAAYAFTLPQNVSLLSCSVSWTGPDQLVDLSLYDPVGTSKSTSLAMTALGNYAIVPNPMAGLWSVALGYGNQAVPAQELDYTLTVDYVAPVPIGGLTSSAGFDTPAAVAPGGTATIHVSIDVPADALPGDVIEGTLDFYTVADGVEAAGGDHLGSVPVTVTVQ